MDSRGGGHWPNKESTRNHFVFHPVDHLSCGCELFPEWVGHKAVTAKYKSCSPSTWWRLIREDTISAKWHLAGNCVGGGWKWLRSLISLVPSLLWTLHHSDSWHPSPLPQKQTNQPGFCIMVLKVWSWVRVSTPPGNLLEMHSLRPHTRPTVRSSVVEPSKLCSAQPSRWF